jgi:hypothetical protein
MKNREVIYQRGRHQGLERGIINEN